jgi:trigger factor
MKTEFVDVNETRKNVRVEIPSDVVDAEIDRVARGYSRTAKVPGFRPGKTPPRVIKQRFKDQILNEVAHELIPRVVGDVLRERGVEPVDTPDVRDVTIEAGQPLTFTASFDTVPAFEPGDYTTLTLRRPSSKVEDEALADALERLRQRAARFEPVEGRGLEQGDTALVDLERSQSPGSPDRSEAAPAHEERVSGAPGVKKDMHRGVSVELGSAANPPGFDQELVGLEPGASKTFSIHFPADYPAAELAGADMTYTVTVHGIKKRVLPELDDEFAKDLGEFESLDALRSRVREDLEHEARHTADREMRAELMKQLAARVPFEVPASLVDREIDRRIEDFARRLMEQQVDPREAGIDWNAFRDSQREPAREAVGGALALDEVARREALEVTDEEVEREVARYSERTGRTPAAVRARLEKEGGMSRIYAGLRREKSIDFLMARATISGEP